MNNIYTEAFSENNPYEYKQKYTSKKGKHSHNGNEVSFTKKAKSCHNSDYKQARDAKRMNWEGV